MNDKYTRSTWVDVALCLTVGGIWIFAATLEYFSGCVYVFDCLK